MIDFNIFFFITTDFITDHDEPSFEDFGNIDCVDIYTELPSDRDQNSLHRSDHETIIQEIHRIDDAAIAELNHDVVMEETIEDELLGMFLSIIGTIIKIPCFIDSGTAQGNFQNEKKKDESFSDFSPDESEYLPSTSSSDSEEE